MAAASWRKPARSRKGGRGRGKTAHAGAAIQLERSLQHLERIFGGMFLALAYFGCDQSQVQRYLTGKSLKDSRISLLFNGVAKIPLQMFILFIGAIVFSFYNFSKPPVVFNQTALHQIEARSEYQSVVQRYDAAFERRKAAAMRVAEANPASLDPPRAATQEYQKR